MRIDKNTVIGKVRILVKNSTQERLSQTCFRGNTKNIAGNFSRWNNAREMFQDPLILNSLIDDIIEATRESSRTNSFDIEFGSFVGWSGTDELRKYRSEDLEQFQPNRKSSALRVRIGRSDLPAPRTTILSIVYELRRERDVYIAIVHSIYPGVDIGELRGNITELEKCVFFDWNHPGSVA